MHDSNWDFDWDTWHRNYKTSNIISFNASGTSFVNHDGTNRRDILNSIEKYESARLIPEPKNLYDSNAIAIHTSQGVIGYVPKDILQEVHLHINSPTNLFKITKKTHEDSGNIYAVIDIMIIDDTNNNTQNGAEEELSFVTRVEGISKADKAFLALTIGNDSFFDAEENEFSDKIELLHNDEFIGYINSGHSKKILDMIRDISLYNAKVPEKQRFAFSLNISFHEIKDEGNGNELYVYVCAKKLTMQEAIMLQSRV